MPARVSLWSLGGLEHEEHGCLLVRRARDEHKNLSLCAMDAVSCWLVSI